MKTQLRGSGQRQTRRYALSLLLATSSLFAPHQFVQAQVNGVGQKPYLGWSTFSEQTINSGFLTQANIQAQSDALAASGLQQHGFQYINIDSGWQSTFDANGRPIPAAPNFPDIKALVDHIHANGQKAGIYWIPGIEQPAVNGNFPILGTPYTTQQIVAIPLAQGNTFAAPPPNPFHDKIDFTKPGAQEYINSIVNLFASWGIDFIKLDSVAPGSDVDSTAIDDRPDVEAWSKAIAQSGLPIWLTVSWDIDQDFLSTWQQFSNARRIDQDIECEGGCATLTDWPHVVLREHEAVGWEHSAGPTMGWNDLDTLDVGDGAIDGLTPDEKQSAITLWAMVNAPMYLGGDLTQLDSFAKSALSNDELIAIDQSTHPGAQVRGGFTPVWGSDTQDGYEYVALFNLNAFPTAVTVNWSDLGFSNALSVRDVWNRIDLGGFSGSFSTVLVGHGSRILRVRRSGNVTEPSGTVYEGESGIFTGTATVSQCAACSGGAEAGFLGGAPGTDTVTFNNVQVARTGTYLMEVDYATEDPRAFEYTINGGQSATLNLGGGSFNLPASTTVPVRLNEGLNVITFGNAGTFAPGLDRIIIRGNGNAIPSVTTTYEAEAATLSGTATAGGCTYCSGGGIVGSFGAGVGNDVTFNNVTVPSSGMYQLEVDYATSGPRTFFATVNNGTPIELDLNGSTFSDPQPIVIPVQLNAGKNTIVFGNPNANGFAPGLDSITVGPIVATSNLSGTITGKIGPENLRLWRLTFTNGGKSVAPQALLNSFTIVPNAGNHGCRAQVLLPMPLFLGSIAPSSSRFVEVPISFTPSCDKEDTFAVHAVFSAGNGADVGTLAISNQTK
ncbi:alpha-galactosidase [Granulicella sp. WH15]|uniref:alpha-galactosidase D n=1 Tax=Granulicella sp. WH15 TaxID=2602070 RepID=UPI001366E002|nr:CBM35 domain-containing protein [Granulicella sp. WH15]QHN03597.1 alpha-galactosidase [Granulicella sp. WH15]